MLFEEDAVAEEGGGPEQLEPRLGLRGPAPSVEQLRWDSPSGRGHRNGLAQLHAPGIVWQSVVELQTGDGPCTGADTSTTATADAHTP